MTRRPTALVLCYLALAWGILMGSGGAMAQAAEPRPRPVRGSARGAAGQGPAVAPEAVEKEEPERPDDRYFAVKGAVVHTVTGPVLDGVTILSKNGRVVAIGHNVAIPEKAEVLDATGFHLYPGLVAVQSRGIVGGEPPENNTDLYGLNVTLGLAGGLTTVLTGNTAAKLTFGTLESHVLKRNLFYTLQYSRQNPSGRARFRNTLERVRQYLRDLEDYEEDKRTDPKAVEPDKKWLRGEYDTALKLLRHEVTAVTDASTAGDLQDLAALVETYGFRLVVRGAHEGWIVAPEIARAGIRLIITPRTRRDADERLNRPNGSSIENARILHDQGVTFAVLPLSSGVSLGGIVGRDLMHLPMEAAFAVRGGLSEDAALRSITIDAARILGTDHRVGSVEIGKDADFVIVDGDLLHYMTLVRWTVVNGRIAYDKEKDSLLDHIRPGGDRDAPPPPDYWPRGLSETP